MQEPLHITFRNMAPSESVAADIRDKVAKLDHLFDRITSCRVVIEAPHRNHQQGKQWNKLFHIRIDLSVPGAELVVNRDPSKHASHADAYVAIRDAFIAAKKQLKDYVDSHFRNHKGPALAALAQTE